MTAAAVVVCTWESGAGGDTDAAEELLTLARKVSSALAADLRWLVLGPSSADILETAARYGAAGVDRISSLKLDTFQGDPYVEALARYCSQHSPRLLLFSQTYDARLVAPR